jgi:hypothetical protein
MEKLEKNQSYLSLSGETLTPENLKEIGALQKLSVMWLQGCVIHDGTTMRKINDDDLTGFAGLTRIQDFCITDTDITDEGMAVIANFPKLKFLNLDGGKITGSAFRDLGKLEKLEVIWLRRTKLRDENLSYFSLFPKLSTLLLQHTEVTHEGLWSLAKLKHLTVPKGGIFTEDDVFEFRKRQIALTIDAPPVDKQTETDVTTLILTLMNGITAIEENLEKLDRDKAEESLKIKQYQAFNDLFDRLCDAKAVRRYTQYGCHFQYFTYKKYVPVIVHQLTKSKIDAYYIEEEHPVRFQMVLKEGAWTLLNRQQSINNKWTNVGL